MLSRKIFLPSLLLSLSISSVAHADERLEIHRDTMAEKGVCHKEAGKVAKGIASALGQKTFIEQVILLDSRGNLETYNVKLQGDGFSSPETNKYWLIRLYDGGDGCMFHSVSLEEAAG